LDHRRDHATCRYRTGQKIRMLPKRKTLECQIDSPNKNLRRRCFSSHCRCTHYEKSIKETF
jgi:hypothetical protein